LQDINKAPLVYPELVAWDINPILVIIRIVAITDIRDRALVDPVTIAVRMATQEAQETQVAMVVRVAIREARVIQVAMVVRVATREARVIQVAMVVQVATQEVLVAQVAIIKESDGINLQKL
jgi:hypothetical protein